MKKIFWAFFTVFLGFFVPFLSFNILGGFFAGQKMPVQIYSAGIANSKIQDVVLKEKEPAIEPAAPLRISLVFVGDIMLGRGVEQSVFRNEAGDFSFLFRQAPFLNEADIAFANLEGPIAVAGKDLGNVYSFKFQPDVLDALKQAGFDAFSVANNHTADWGAAAFEENLFRLKNKEILPVGGGFDRQEASSVQMIEKNGIKIGFLGFSDVGPNWFKAGENTSGISIVDSSYDALVKKAAGSVDVLVVSLHFGEEYATSSNSRQKDLAHRAIDAGAKIVAGHHPHVIQEVENYNGGAIAYSLGNFIFDQNFSEETMEGLVLEVLLSGKEISGIKTSKVKINNLYQPQLE